MSDLQKRTALLVIVATAFIENPKADELHVTPDGNCFTTENATYANSHARRTNQKVEVVKRDDVSKEIDAINAKAEKAAAEKAATAKAEETKEAEEKAAAAKAEKEKQAAEKAAKAKAAKDKKEAGADTTQENQTPPDPKSEEQPTK